MGEVSFCTFTNQEEQPQWQQRNEAELLQETIKWVVVQKTSFHIASAFPTSSLPLQSQRKRSEEFHTLLLHTDQINGSKHKPVEIILKFLKMILEGRLTTEERHF